MELIGRCNCVDLKRGPAAIRIHTKHTGVLAVTMPNTLSAGTYGYRILFLILLYFESGRFISWWNTAQRCTAQHGSIGFSHLLPQALSIPADFFSSTRGYFFGFVEYSLSRLTAD
jgi:hypothetical protein